MAQHVDHILLGPCYSVARILVEETMVSVPALCRIPLVEILQHHHEAHLVAKLDQLLGRHVVRSADRVAAHVLEDGELASDSSLVDRRSERTEVMMHAHSLEFAHLSVEEEALLRADLDASDSEAGPHLVEHDASFVYRNHRPAAAPVGVNLRACIYLCISIIKYRSLRRPEFRILHCKLMLHFAAEKLAGVLALSDHLSRSVPDNRPDSHRSAVLHTLDAGAHGHVCAFLTDIWRSHICTPYRNMYARHGDMSDLPEQTGSRIPARRLGPVLQLHPHLILAFHEEVGHIAPERIVSVRPETYLLAHHEHLRLAHRSVEEKYVPASVQRARRYLKAVPVCALTHIRKASCAACLYRSHLLAVLSHSHRLKVVRPVERTVDGPVVRHLHLAPSLHGPVVVSLAELPVSQYLLASEILCRKPESHESSGKGRNEMSYLHTDELY